MTEFLLQKRGRRILQFPRCAWHRPRKFTIHSSVESTVTQYGNYGNSLSRIFGKYFVKVMDLLNKLLKSWFDEIFFRWEWISRFSTLWVIYSHTLNYGQKFRVNNGFTKEVTEELIWRNIFFGESKFLILFHSHCALTIFSQKFREINMCSW